MACRELTANTLIILMTGRSENGRVKSSVVVKIVILVARVGDRIDRAPHPFAFFVTDPAVTATSLVYLVRGLLGTCRRCASPTYKSWDQVRSVIAVALHLDVYGRSPELLVLALVNNGAGLDQKWGLMGMVISKAIITASIIITTIFLVHVMRSWLIAVVLSIIRGFPVVLLRDHLNIHIHVLDWSLVDVLVRGCARLLLLLLSHFQIRIIDFMPRMLIPHVRLSRGSSSCSSTSSEV